MRRLSFNPFQTTLTILTVYHIPLGGIQKTGP